MGESPLVNDSFQKQLRDGGTGPIPFLNRSFQIDYNEKPIRNFVPLRSMLHLQRERPGAGERKCKYRHPAAVGPTGLSAR